jgi:hypothetical protein
MFVWLLLLGWVTTQSVTGTTGTSSDTVPYNSDFVMMNFGANFKGTKVISTRKKTVILKGSIKPKNTTAKVVYCLKSPKGKLLKAQGSSKAWIITLKNLRLGKTKVYVFAVVDGKLSKPVVVVVKRTK